MKHKVNFLLGFAWLMTSSLRPAFGQVGQTEIAKWQHGRAESYDLPLTLKTYVPSKWSAVEVRQGNQVKSVQVGRDKGKAHVMYQAVPNGQPVTLTKEGT